MSAFIAFVVANAGVILGLAFAIISLLTAIFDKNEKATGILAVIRSVLERLSALQPRNAEGTVKLPGAKPGPTKVL